MKNALIITTVSGFLLKFETDNIRLLQQQGYTVHYAANMNEPQYLFDPKRLEDLGVTAHHIDIARSPFMVGNNLHALQRVARLIDTYQIDLIHCHTPVGGLIGRLAPLLSKHRPSVIYTAHGFHFYNGASRIHNLVYGGAEGFLARFTDSLVLINAEDYQAAQRFQLSPGGKTYLIPGIGLDMNHFSPVTPRQKSEYRRKHGLPDDVFLILSVGELNENKNQLVILKVLQQLLAQATAPDSIHYGICGDGFYREKMAEQIRQMGLERHVTMFGYCLDVREYVAMADVVVFPSRREGLGMAALEALSMGIPVVASDNRGTREYMQPGVNGYICDCDDVDGYARNITRILQMSRAEREELGIAARASVERFDRHATSSIMEEVYSDTIRKAGQ